MAGKLRAVGDGETPPERPKSRSVTVAAAEGTRRDLLVAVRARIATTVQDASTPARDLAALSRRLLEIAKEIELIDATEAGDPVGDAAATPDDAWDASAI